MKKIIVAVFSVIAVSSIASAAGSLHEVVKFSAAEAVWPAGLENEMNEFIGFSAAFDQKAGEKPVLKLVGWASYRITLNGRFVGFGPARGPEAFFRADEWDLASVARAGRNELLIEVAGYNVPSYYLMDQRPFLKAEVAVDGKVLAKTAAEGGDFAARRLPKVKKVPRYTFQRTFSEYYRLPGAAASPLPLAKAPEPTLIPRLVPYPDFEVANPRPVSFAVVKVDSSVKTHADRSLVYPGRKGYEWFKGYRLEDLELNTAYLAQQLAYSDRRDATEEERRKSTFDLASGRSIVFDVGVNDTGFAGAMVKVEKPGRLYITFDEVLSPGGKVSGIDRYRDCNNVVVWDFEAPGEYDIATFEPYTMRYFDVGVLSGEMTISGVRFRSYKNPTAKRASFRCSDPVLEAIFAAASETFRQNAVDVFMDCPSRERAGWNCDAFFTAPVSTLLTGNTDLERVFEENIALAAKFDGLPDGMIPMCYPANHRDNVFIPNWAMWFVLETEEYLQRSGDRATIERLRIRLSKLVEYLQGFRNSDGLLEKLPSWVFVEWSRCNKLVQDVNYPSNMTWADVLEAMDRLYGRPDLAAEAKRVRAAVLKQSWNGKWFCDNAVRQKDGTLKLSGECTETCQYYAFLHRVATPKSHPALWRTMLDEFGPFRFDPKDRTKLLRHREIWPSNAFIGNYLRLKLLERERLGERILAETKGYFKYMVDRTGTLWENDTTCASCNHGFASYPAVLLVRCVLGADVDLRKKTVTLRKTDAKVDFCEVTLPVGPDSLRITRTLKNGRIEFNTVLPAGWREERD